MRPGPRVPSPAGTIRLRRAGKAPGSWRPPAHHQRRARPGESTHLARDEASCDRSLAPPTQVRTVHRLRTVDHELQPPVARPHGGSPTGTQSRAGRDPRSQSCSAPCPLRGTATWWELSMNSQPMLLRQVRETSPLTTSIAACRGCRTAGRPRGGSTRDRAGSGGPEPGRRHQALRRVLFPAQLGQFQVGLNRLPMCAAQAVELTESNHGMC
jgi:hypothetical protein